MDMQHTKTAVLAVALLMTGSAWSQITVTIVAEDWELIPYHPVQPINPGDRFRFIFIPDFKLNNSVSSHNNRLQTGDSGNGGSLEHPGYLDRLHPGIAPHKAHFRHLGCAKDKYTAKSNTNTGDANGTTRIFWLNGSIVANSHKELYRGNWHNEAVPTNESGERVNRHVIGTGCVRTGNRITPAQWGNNTVAIGWLNDDGVVESGPNSGKQKYPLGLNGGASGKGGSFYFYAMTGEFAVGHNRFGGVEFTGDGIHKLVDGNPILHSGVDEVGIEGRLMVRRGTGAWGSVCDDRFNRKAARLVCRTLGRAGDEVVVHGFSRPDTGVNSSNPIHLDDVRCTKVHDDTAEKLEDCFHAGWGLHNCTHAEDVGVQCGLRTQGQSAIIEPEPGSIEYDYHSDYFLPPISGVTPSLADGGYSYKKVTKNNPNMGKVNQIRLSNTDINGDELPCEGTPSPTLTWDDGTAISFSGRSSAGAATVDGHCRIRVQPADVSAQIDDATGYMTVEGL